MSIPTATVITPPTPEAPYLPESSEDAKELHILRALIKTEAAQQIHAAASDALDHLTAKVADEVAEKAKTGLMAALAYHKKQSDGMLAEVKRELEAYQKPTPLAVKINDAPEIKLKQRPAACLKDLLINQSLGINSLIVGPAGCGKTTAAEQLAQVLGRDFAHINFTVGASEAWLLGRHNAHGFIPAPFELKFRNGGVFLGDELDAADPNTLMCIQTALANGYLYNPMTGETIQRHPDFIFVATANTVGKGADFTYTARNRLDAATLDRFSVLFMDYSAELERELCPNEWANKKLTRARAVLTEKRSTEIISTRAFDRTYKLLGAGVSWEEIVKRLTAGWSKELVEASELLSEPAPKQGEAQPEAAQAQEKRGPGRPRGSPNKPKSGGLGQGVGGFFSGAELSQAYVEYPQHLTNDAIPF